MAENAAALAIRCCDCRRRSCSASSRCLAMVLAMMQSSLSPSMVPPSPEVENCSMKGEAETLNGSDLISRAGKWLLVVECLRSIGVGTQFVTIFGIQPIGAFPVAQ